MAKMTSGDAAALKLFQKQYGTKVYPSPPKATTANSAKKQNEAKLKKKK